MLHSTDSLVAESSRLKRTVTRLAVGVMQPLARILLRNGMSCQEFTEICRWSFVDAVLSGDEFRIEGRKPTKSRVSVLTGLSRKEVQRLMDLPLPSDKYEKLSCNRAARVLAGWLGDPLYQDSKTAKPADLVLQGSPPSFADLVKRYSGDVPFRAVLDELLRCRNVTIEGDARIRLLDSSYTPPSGSVEQVDAVYMILSDLFSTIEYNLRHGSKERRIQRNTYHGSIPSHDLPAFRSYAKELLEKLDKDCSLYISEKFSGRKLDEEHRRAGIGFYYFES